MPQDTLRTFYEAFAARDAETMAACYAPDATFEDPVFELAGRDVGDMWRMLIERGRDLGIEYELLSPTRARWTATYTFGHRSVRNEIQSEFELDRDGRIVREVDTFDFPRWASQALGWKGKLFGRLGFLRAAVRKQSAATLERWQRRRSSGDGEPPPEV